ncbi:MAG: type I-U CRISPR-associated protein Csx17 [Candidatus Eisenbacteria bacterium]
MHEIRFDGCCSRPLLDYLKGLGLLRAIAMQADPSARAAWPHDRLMLVTSLTADQVVTFLAEEFQPSPVLDPWNMGSGFWKAGDAAGRSLATIEASLSPRFLAHRTAIASVRWLIEDLGLKDGPGDADQKLMLVQRCRAELPEEALDAIDAALVLTEDRVRYGAILGTGWNDGKLDFASNRMQRLLDLIDPKTGAARSGSKELLVSALMGGGEVPLSGAAVGQFHPAGVGGANATTGFEGGSIVNPWDFVLALEGVLLLAGSATRRLGTQGSIQVSFPFAVEPSGCGNGGMGRVEETTDQARAEIWLPLWSRPATLREVRKLFAEGRAQVGRRRAKNGIDFVRAIRSLGVDRGIDAFQRFAFLKRIGGATFVATPLERVVTSRELTPHLGLLEEIDPWIDALERFTASKSAPQRFLTALLQLKRSLYEYGLAPRSRPFSSVVCELGRCERKIVGAEVPPLQRLSAPWVAASDDGSCEFRIAKALASRFSLDPRIRCLLEPVSLDPRKGRYEWATDRSIGSNIGRSLPERLATLADRLDLEGIDPYEAGRHRAMVTDVSAFVQGRTDDARIEDFLSAFLCVDWVHVPPTRPRGSVVETLRAYALLKMLALDNVLVPSDSGGWALAGQAMTDAVRPRITPAMRAQLRSGRLSSALVSAVRVLRASGLPPLLDDVSVTRLSLSARERTRVSGALMIPIGEGRRLADLILEPPNPQREMIHES